MLLTAEEQRQKRMRELRQDHAVSEYGKKAVTMVVHELARLFPGVTPDGSEGFDLNLPYLTYRGFRWERSEAAREEGYPPNLDVLNVKVWWFRHIGRGMMVNAPLTQKEWSKWLLRVLQYINQYEERHNL